MAGRSPTGLGRRRTGSLYGPTAARGGLSALSPCKPCCAGLFGPWTGQCGRPVLPRSPLPNVSGPFETAVVLGSVDVAGSLPFCLAHVRRFAPLTLKDAGTTVSSADSLLLLVVGGGCLLHHTKAAVVDVGLVDFGSAEDKVALFLIVLVGLDFLLLLLLHFLNLEIDFGFGFEFEFAGDEDEEGSSEDPGSDPCCDDFLVPAFNWEHFLL